MITVTVRPYSEEEKQQLLSLLPTRYQRFEGYFLKFIFLLGAQLLPFLLLDKYVHFSSDTQLICCVVLLITTAFALQRLNRKYDGHEETAQSIATGQAEIIRVSTTRAVRREDPEDFGVAFYIDVNDAEGRKTLYLCGQHLDELEADNLFPNTEFELIRSAGTKSLIDLKVFGQAFQPEKTLPAFSDEEWRSGRVPGDGSLLNQSIDSIS